MLKEKNYFFQRLNQLLDAVAIALAFLIALETRNRFLVPNLFPREPIIHIAGHHWLLWIMIPLMLLAQKYLGVYNSQRLRKPADLLLPITLSAIIASGVTGVLVIGLSRTVGPDLGIISLPQIPYFGLWVIALLMIKTAALRRFFLPSGAVASMCASSCWWAAGMSSPPSSISLIAIPSGDSG
jgi:hypothetical protein